MAGRQWPAIHHTTRTMAESPRRHSRLLRHAVLPVVVAVVSLGPLGFVGHATSQTPVVWALDPSPDPSADPGPSATPDPQPTPDPTPPPTPDPTPDPTLDPAPTATPDPTIEPPTPEPTPGPTPDPPASPSPDPSATAQPDPASSDAPSAPPPSAEPSAEPSAAPSSAPATPTGVEVTHAWVDELARDGTVVRRGGPDDPFAGMTRFVVYDVRFQLLNAGPDPITVNPQLEVGNGADPGSFVPVPAVDPVPGVPFYAASDDGSTYRVRTSAIELADLRLDSSADPDARPVVGARSDGRNPAPALILPAGSYTEIAFAVRATIDAAWTGSYAFRLGPDASFQAGGGTAIVTLRSRPPAIPTLPASGPDVQYQLVAPSSFAFATALDSPHEGDTLTADGCAACHSAHRSSAGTLLAAAYRIDPLPSSTEAYDGADFALCLACHAETPFADTSGSPVAQTAFPGHGYHLGHLQDRTGGGGTDLTVSGDGVGDATCAECHYDLHASPERDPGLVRFAPDVLPYQGVIRYDAATGSCTLTCHGRDHAQLTFQPAN